MRRELKRFGGKDVSTAGDSFFATFNGALPGVRCGQSIVTGLGQTGLATRVGLHLGECEMLCEWLADAGLAFGEHGVHALKRVPGEWRLNAVTGT